jgi:hypothetical protein
LSDPTFVSDSDVYCLTDLPHNETILGQAPARGNPFINGEVVMPGQVGHQISIFVISERSIPEGRHSLQKIASSTKSEKHSDMLKALGKYLIDDLSAMKIMPQLLEEFLAREKVKEELNESSPLHDKPPPTTSSACDPEAHGRLFEELMGSPQKSSPDEQRTEKARSQSSRDHETAEQKTPTKQIPGKPATSKCGSSGSNANGPWMFIGV